MIQADKIAGWDEVAGNTVAFRDGTYDFYNVAIQLPWWRLSRVAVVLFRVKRGRYLHDRYNDFLINDRPQMRGWRGTSPFNIRFLFAAPASDAQVLGWMRSHYWTFQMKGFPLAKKWLEQIDWEEYDRQSAEVDRPKRWKINRKTLKVTPT